MPRSLLALLFAIPAVTACGETGTQIPPVIPIEQQAFAPSLNVNLAASTKTAHGVYVRDLAAGSGPALAAGQTVQVGYTGWLPDGTKFDSSTAYPFAFRTGAVIAGWDEGLIGAQVGTTRQLIIPPGLAYGAAGAGAIPPNANLVFVVSVTSAK